MWLATASTNIGGAWRWPRPSVSPLRGDQIRGFKHHNRPRPLVDSSEIRGKVRIRLSSFEDGCQMQSQGTASATEALDAAAVAARERRSLLPPDWEQRRYLTVNEAKAAVPASHDKLYRLIREGRLEVRKLGRRSLISTASIKALHDSLPR